MEASVKVRRIADFMLGATLGKGTFGHVRIATRLEDTTPNYAIKYMKVGKPYPKEFLLKILKQELILKELDHPNILKIYGISTDGIYEKIAQESIKVSVVYLVLQLARSGDLFDFIIGSDGFAERVARWYFNQLLGAVEHIHSLGFAHRDIKPQNVLLDHNYNPLLTDFGLSIKLSEVGFITKNPAERVGTEKCMSPELYAALPHSPTKDDLFALGYTLFIIVAKYPPFSVASITNDRFRLLKDNNVLEYWKCIDPGSSPKYSSEFKHLLTLMLAADMTIRPSISEIRLHPWVKGEVPSQSEIIAEFDKRQEEAIKFQRKEAEARKLRKQKQQPKTEVIVGGKRKLAPHILKRAVDIEEVVISKSSILKILSEFGDYKKHKPTVLMSQETAKDIEEALISLCSIAKSLVISDKKYKVFL